MVDHRPEAITYCIVLHCIVLYCVALHCITLYYILYESPKRRVRMKHSVDSISECHLIIFSPMFMAYKFLKLCFLLPLRASIVHTKAV